MTGTPRAPRSGSWRPYSSNVAMTQPLAVGQVASRCFKRLCCVTFGASLAEETFVSEVEVLKAELQSCQLTVEGEFYSETHMSDVLKLSEHLACERGVRSLVLCGSEAADQGDQEALPHQSHEASQDGLQHLRHCCHSRKDTYEGTTLYYVEIAVKGSMKWQPQALEMTCT